jgi:hypothetical protein
VIRTVSERDALLRQVRHFFFHPAVMGLYRFEKATFDKPEPVERRPGQQREAGKFHDKLVARFGPFALEVIGPFESDSHPLGRAKLDCRGVSIDGPLDATTWDKLANFLKEHHREEEDHGHGSASVRGSDTGCGGGSIPGWGSGPR